MTRPAMEIDGSHGEGGGQILRTSLALSLVTGRALRLVNLRAGRAKPGLMRQHLAAVRAAAEIGRATVAGDRLGSQELSFCPRATEPGQYHFAIGTAGSATLVVQTVLPALIMAHGPSEISVEGGTHNPWAPTYDFLARAFFPLLNRLGPQVTSELQQWGFYPAGGGRLSVSVRPCDQLRGFKLTERGEIVDRSATVLLSHLEPQIARRELAVVSEKLGWPAASLRVADRINSVGPGNVLVLELQAEHVNEVFTSCGRIGVSAEKVAMEAVQEVCDYLAADVPVGPHLADQLGLAAWQSGQGGEFLTMPLTMHSLTHIGLLQRWLEIPIAVQPDGLNCRVCIGPSAVKGPSAPAPGP